MSGSVFEVVTWAQAEAYATESQKSRQDADATRAKNHLRGITLVMVTALPMSNQRCHRFLHAAARRTLQCWRRLKPTLLKVNAAIVSSASQRHALRDRRHRQDCLGY
jgi:hypothetical protein